MPGSTSQQVMSNFLAAISNVSRCIAQFNLEEALGEGKRESKRKRAKHYLVGLVTKKRERRDLRNPRSQ